MSTDLSVSLNKILDLCQQLTPIQAEGKAAPDAWSVSEILEHLAVVERAALVGIKRSLAQPPASDEILSSIAHKSEIISTRVSIPLMPIVAPDSVVPTDRFGRWPAALDGFEKVRKNTIQAAAKKDERFDTHTMPHPILGDLTLRQWFEFLNAHAARHCIQIASVLKSA